MLSPDPQRESSGPGNGLTLGVLALQGDFREHRAMLERLGARTREVRNAADLVDLDGLVIPGGESTTMSKLLDAYDLTGPVRAFVAAGRGLLGTCAGLILAARDTVEGAPPTLDLIDITVRRNAFGRQVSSFEADLSVAGLQGDPMRAVFIRAPWIERVGPEVEILAEWEGHVVAARQDRVLVTAFHPELTDDARLHALFLHMLRDGHHAPVGKRNGTTYLDATDGATIVVCVN
ncbi:MAG: pyridoxal 5'-phosphate synthase glutaminase subunit PdxT [Thermoleophilia bacterium]